jgi:hypothetical protein
MFRILKHLQHEIMSMLPAVAFFFVAFNLIVLTDTLTTESYGIRVFSFLAATGLAIVVGKVMLLVNFLPFVNAFRTRPLIYNTIWRAALYTVASLVVRYLEMLIRLTWKLGSLTAANRHIIADMNWPRFWAVQIWLAALFLVFAALQEITRAMGAGRLRALFFGR